MPTVLILGAASDMAVAIAHEMAAKGHDLQLAARKTDRLEPLRADLQIRYTIQCTLHEFDAENCSQHAAFYEQLPVKPSIAICVFGYLGENEKARTDWQEAARIIQTNYTGAVSILNVISNDFADRKSGVIVGVSSVAGERGRQSNYIYGSAKAGFTAYLSGLRNRMFREGVHVMSVQPGFVYTRMTEGLALPPLLTAQPDQVAKAISAGINKKKNIIYVKWFWRWIMMIICLIPEFLFKKLKL